jgi:transposase-like protein
MFIGKRLINIVPMNLADVYSVLPTKQDCMEYLEIIRWNGVPVCPYCGSNKKSDLPNEMRYHCNKCNSSYSVIAGTIFNKTKCDLQKWFYVISLVLSKQAFTLRTLSKQIDVTKDTLWLMLQKIQKAYSDERELLISINELKENIK